MYSFHCSLYGVKTFSTLVDTTQITAAGVVPCGGPKKSPHTSSIMQIILFLSVL